MSLKKISLVFFLLVITFLLKRGVFVSANAFDAYDHFVEFRKSAYKNFLQKYSKEYSMVAVGDVSYSRAVERAVKNRDNLFYPFEKVRDFISGADIAFANIETTIMEGRPIQDFEMVFRSNPSTADVLKEVGFDVVSLANNHTPDFRLKGVQDTIYNLNRVDILHSGLGENLEKALQPAVIDLGDFKVSIISFLDPAFVPDSYGAEFDSYGTLFMNDYNLESAMMLAKEKSDLVFVSMHAGSEYVNNPNSFQVDFARKAIDLGAEMVIGHHPHVVQSMEKYKDKYIFYSLGNFVFDQPFSYETKAGVMLDIKFDYFGVNAVILKPYYMSSFVQPEFVEGDSATRILDMLNYDFDLDENISL